MQPKRGKRALGRTTKARTIHPFRHRHSIIGNYTHLLDISVLLSVYALNSTKFILYYSANHVAQIEQTSVKVRTSQCLL